VYADIVVWTGRLSAVKVADKRSLDFVQTRLLMKWFNTGSVDIVHECCVMFDIRTVSSLIVSRKRKFLTKFMNNHNSICGAVSALARRELNDLNWLYLYSCMFVCLFVFLSAVIEWRIKLNIECDRDFDILPQKIQIKPQPTMWFKYWPTSIFFNGTFTGIFASATRQSAEV